MRPTKTFLATILIAILSIAACSPRIDVRYNNDPDFDFKRIETFRWLGIQNDGSIPPFDVRRMGKGQVANLEKKGLRETDSTQVDVLIAGYLGITPLQSKKWEYSHGLYWTEKVTSVPQGTLILDVVDAGTRKLVWRAVGNGTYRKDRTPAQRDHAVERVAKKMLKSFP